jgi:hypothetical protein
MPVPALPTPPEPMAPRWRGVCAIVGAALLALALVLWFAPPAQNRFAPQAKDGTGVAKVDAPSETLSVALLGLGVVLLLVAANGRKLVSVKVGGNEIDWDQFAKAAEKKTEARAAQLNLSRQELSTAKSLVPQLVYLSLTKGHGLDFDDIADHAIATAQAIHTT